jgi:hypothetical protein
MGGFNNKESHMKISTLVGKHEFKLSRSKKKPGITTATKTVGAYTFKLEVGEKWKFGRAVVTTTADDRFICMEKWGFDKRGLVISWMEFGEFVHAIFNREVTCKIG